MDQLNLTQKDIEKLKFVLDSLNKGNACTIDKSTCISFLDSIINPKCAVCRGLISDDIVVVNDRKMHGSCRKKYRG